MSSLYKFDTNTAPITMYEWDDGVWKRENLSLNETLILNLDNTITLKKTYANYQKMKIFAQTADQNDASDLYTKTAETYAQLNGTTIGSDPSEELEDDGIEDDQDSDGSNDDLLNGSDNDDVEHGGAGDDFVDGGSGHDDIYGDEGDDDLNGGEGDDLLVGGIGFDVLLGGNGNDDLDGNDDDDRLDGGDGADSLDGGNGADYLSGGLGNDSLIGGAGNDELYSEVGNDTVDGGNGNDLIIGGSGAGNDTYIGGSGSDTVKYTSATASIEVNLTSGKAKSVAADAGIGIDKLSTIENVIGGGYNDFLTGSSSTNSIKGGAGRDAINGMAGNDILRGDLGNDTLNGGTGSDALFGGKDNDTFILDNIGDSATELRGEGTDVVKSSVSVSGVLADNSTTAYIGDYVENIILTGSAALSATGNGLSNTIIGNSGTNVLRGGTGSDTLTGGLGKDTLYGGADADVFKFNLITETKTGNGKRDVIADFSSGDHIDLSGMDAKAGFTADDAFTFLGSTGPTLSNANGALWFTNGVLYGSTDGDVAAEFEIAVTGVVLMTADDFFL